MADNTETSLKKHVDYAQSQVDEQAILDKYNAATLAQYNAQREQNRQAENQFYNQMYNTQKTAMDTIRQSNAAAVSTGASRGMQAANELSAILGLQSENVASATELAQANRQTAQEETAAVLENVLNAYQAAQQERSQLVSQGIEAAFIEQQQQAADQQAKAARDEYLRNLHASDPAAYYREQAKDNAATDFVNMTDEQFTANRTNAYQAIDEISDELKYDWNDFADWDWGESGSSKGEKIKTKLRNIYAAYGLTEKQADDTIKNLNNTMSNYNRKQLGDRSDPALKQAAINYLQSQFNLQYAAQRVASKTTKQ